VQLRAAAGLATPDKAVLAPHPLVREVRGRVPPVQQAALALRERALRARVLRVQFQALRVQVALQLEAAEVRASPRLRVRVVRPVAEVLQLGVALQLGAAAGPRWVRVQLGRKRRPRKLSRRRSRCQARTTV
jgi:hypothetical protein